MIVCYHGCSESVITELVAGNIDVSIGGGELGRGFYTSIELWTAKIWALNLYKSETVLKIEMPWQEFEKLKPLVLTFEQTCDYHKRIKKLRATRTYLFHRHVIWSPIVGDQMNGKDDQFKWESKTAELLLKGEKVKRTQV
jgi:hypothetical protein